MKLAFPSLSRTARLLASLALPFSVAACGGNVKVEDPPETTPETTPPPDCDPGLSLCGDVCADLSTDALNCGSCGHGCGDGACQNSTCLTSTGVVCPGGATLCGMDCYNLFSDPQHCGACENACNPGETCNGGSCAGPQCVTCAEYITPDANPNNYDLCPGSVDFYDALVQCVCNGACVDVCNDNVCIGTDITPECQGCVTDTMVGCGNEFNACANDI